MQTKLGHSIEITHQLSSQAAQELARWIGCYTVIYNQKTMEADRFYKEWLEADKPESGKPLLNTQVAKLKQSFEFLSDIPSQIRRNAGAKWFEAMNAALVGLRNKPKVKAKHKKRNCYVTNELFDVQHIDDDRCLVQIKRSDKKEDHGRYLAGVVLPFPKEKAGKAFFLSRKGSRFWLSMAYDYSNEDLTQSEVEHITSTLTHKELEQAVVGIDLGINKQAVSSKGFVYHMPEDVQKSLLDVERKKSK